MNTVLSAVPDNERLDAMTDLSPRQFTNQPSASPDDPLRFAGLDAAAQAMALREIVSTDADLMALLRILRDSGLPDAWLSSGAVYGTVWNVLTGQPQRTGIKDYDFIYFDGGDPSFEAEDREIKRIERLCAPLGLPVELRNQARVHLWYPDRFGGTYPQLGHATESLLYYASKTHAVAVQLRDGELRLSAPFGLDPVFAFRQVPNTVLDNRATYLEKAERARRVWPVMNVEPWPEQTAA